MPITYINFEFGPAAKQWYIKYGVMHVATTSLQQGKARYIIRLDVLTLLPILDQMPQMLRKSIMSQDNFQIP